MSEYKWPLMKNTISIGDRLKLAKFVLTSDRFTAGTGVKKFEKEWSDWLGCKESLFVSSGSTANLLLLSAVKELYGLKDGDKVLVPACTWVTNICPVIQVGLQPIFCDINLKDYSFSLDHFKKIIQEHPDIKVIFVTHLLGYSADVETLRTYLPNALILEDVCESHGCLGLDGKKRGSEYIGGTFSFYFGHHMTTIEGGMVSTNNEELADLMRMKRSHGLARESKNFEKYKQENKDIIASFLFVTDGYNFRNTDLGAVLGSSQLKRLAKMVDKRNQNYQRYYSEVRWHADKFYVPDNNSRMSSFAFPFICRTKSCKNGLISLFEDNKIEYRPVVSGNLLKQPFLKGHDLGIENSNVDILHENGVYIANNHFVGDREFKVLQKILKQL
jgi:CDP-4-dehydro-6-deoxyglucose reductase, E1